jgi:hypothetical protein
MWLMVAAIFWAVEGRALIVGTDDRSDVHRAGGSAIQLSASVGALVHRSRVRGLNDHVVELQGPTLRQALEAVWRAPVCSTERFQQQPTLAKCSGVLIGESLFLTARHCIFDERTCRDTLVVFDYFDLQGELARLPTRNVFSCARIVRGSHSYRPGGDWVVVSLDRTAAPRPAVALARSPAGNPLGLVIGTPSGLPLKAIPGVMDYWTEGTLHGFFDLAVYASGSPLFNSRGELLGIFTNQALPDHSLATGGCVNSNTVQVSRHSLVTFQNLTTVFQRDSLVQLAQGTFR